LNIYISVISFCILFSTLYIVILQEVEDGVFPSIDTFILMTTQFEEKIDINHFFISFVYDHPFTFVFYFILLFLYPLHRVVLPKYYGKVISSLKDSGKSPSLSFFTNVVYLLTLYVIIQIMYAVMYKVQGYFIPKFSEQSIQKIFSFLMNNKNLDYENLETGEILSKIIKVPNVIYKYLDLLKTLLFSQIMVIASCLYHYFNISTYVGCIFMFLVVGVCILQYISYKLTLDIELKREHEKDKIYQHFQDVLNNMMSVVVCKQEEHEKGVLHDRFIPFTRIFEKSLNMNFIIRIIFSLFNVFSFILLNFVIYKAYLNKQIDQEHFISSFIVTYSILSIFNEAYYAIRSIIDIYSQVHDTENYFNEKQSSSDLSRNDVTEKNEVDADYVHGDIVFENVFYNYQNTSTACQGKIDKENDTPDTCSEPTYAVKNISLVINKNENVALVGHIGSGKSTLIKMLMKLAEPTRGHISIGGVDLKHITRETLYDHVFYIPQKPKLLNRPLYDNIMYGVGRFDNDTRENNIKHINDILRQMRVDKHMVKVFNEKLKNDDNVGVDGSKLSGGQRQMVWIIRALLRNPKIMILDEPTASLDQKHKSLIMDCLKHIGKNKTIIVISHDNVDYSFRKIEMKGGNLMQSQSQSHFNAENSPFMMF
jgi:ABC-type multidrug transport system fused ATPase/permease subunit